MARVQSNIRSETSITAGFSVVHPTTSGFAVQVTCDWSRGGLCDRFGELWHTNGFV